MSPDILPDRIHIACDDHRLGDSSSPLLTVHLLDNFAWVSK